MSAPSISEGLFRWKQRMAYSRLNSRARLPRTGNRGTALTSVALVESVSILKITRRANRLPRWIRRHGGYALSLPPALLRFRPLRVRIETEEGGLNPPSHDATAMLVAFANAPVYGDGIRIAPKAQLDDGKLDICVVGEMGKLRLLRLFSFFIFGRSLEAFLRSNIFRQISSGSAHRNTG